jgi:GGDEF domain-containing protein
MDLCVVKPVTDMTRAISEISFDEDGMIRGEDDSKHSLKKLEINSGDEMEELYKTLKKFQLDTSEYLISMRDDSWEKEHDSMTMLANGVKFNKRKKEVYPYADSIYIACLNIINLHVVNDKISSEAGDGIISKVARELRRLNSENIHAYRLEEDHFLLVFCGYLEEEAISVLTKWVDRVGRLNRNSDEFECRLVWGGAYGEGLFDVDDVYKHADTELYCNTAVTKKNLKSEVWRKSNGLCAKCGKAVSTDKQTIDHFIPKYHGGTDDFRNLIPLCKACNRAKGSRLMTVEECCKYLDKEFIDDLSKYSK